MLQVDQVKERVEALFPQVQRELIELLRIPSVNAEEKHRADVIAAALFVQDLFEDTGLATEIVRAPRPGGTVGAPAVLAWTEPVEGWPTVLLYAHHDVQPVTGQQGWENDPFDPVLVGQEDAEAAGQQSGPRGRLVARGTADDKAGVVAHAAAIRALGEDRRVNLVVLIEGEEEIGSPSMPALIDQYRDRFRADAVIVIDGNMWRVGTPMMTASMRGLLVGDVTVEAFEAGLHSGGYGGPVLDANVLAARLVASLHDDEGMVAVAGLDTGVASQSRGAEIDEQFFRADATLLTDTEMTGEHRRAGGLSGIPGQTYYLNDESVIERVDSPRLLDKPGISTNRERPGQAPSLTEQLWVKPSVSVIGIDATPTESAPGVLAPTAKFRLSLRLPPDLAPEDAAEALDAHLQAHRPFGAVVKFEPKQAAKGYVLDLNSVEAQRLRGALEDAWGAPSVAAGVGGTVPLLSMLDQAFPGVAILKVGTGDPDSKPHGQNESASQDVLFDLIVALTLFLDRTAEPA